MNLFVRKTILNLVEANVEYNDKSSCNATKKTLPVQTRPFENLAIPEKMGQSCLNPVLTNKHFSHVTKTRVFKNLNLRRKTNRSFCGNFFENHSRHLKLYSTPPTWLVRSHCHMGTFCKTKG